MRQLNVFNFTTLNGYYKGPQEDIGWHSHGGPENEYGVEAMKANSTLVFGRVTYEMMSSYWPTPDAIKNMPEMAKGMNEAEKIVFSKTLKKADWNNTTIIKDINEMATLKKGNGPDMTILGSGSIITQLAGLIDTYQIMIDPIALGDGTPMFKGMKTPLHLELVDTKTFKSGVILLSYQRIP
ncbi:dihydrofolate reductase [Chitinophaga sp. SYP-B3965]|uniref:dihydrofolate reductase family protein n=1 Tax=Chitinophaga sp. SYP-B3965 TaxID=2663120 RepID=UPI001299D53C|nr:dihydrofolate reductase family protein [Chitinophaga sp. SYP-B3965]MRG45033.1 dihydrofolate reductase [Chitinophaga sp. SYP-B3965]